MKFITIKTDMTTDHDFIIVIQDRDVRVKIKFPVFSLYFPCIHDQFSCVFSTYIGKKSLFLQMASTIPYNHLFLPFIQQ